MKILYVVARPLEINTSASIRNFATLNGLIGNGHQVTIVSSLPDKNHTAYDESLIIKDANRISFELGGIQLFAKLGRKFKFLKKLRPLISDLVFRNEMYDNLKNIINHTGEIDVQEYDLVISSSDPKSSHLFVDCLLAKNKTKIQWIQIWGDPFANDITRRGGDINAIVKEENRLLLMADKIVYVSKLTCMEQKKRYPECAERMHYYPIPYIQERISKKPFPYSYPDLKLCYCGDYNSKIRDIIPLYNSAVNLDLELTICGISDLNLPSVNRVLVYPRQEASKIRELEDSADVLVHLSNRTGTQIPGKIYQYSATDKTILFVLDGNAELLKDTFKEYNRFIFSSNDEKSISQTLKNICEIRKHISNQPVPDFAAQNISQNIIDI